jgi:hypothetical protein
VCPVLWGVSVSGQDVGSCCCRRLWTPHRSRHAWCEDSKYCSSHNDDNCSSDVQCPQGLCVEDWCPGCEAVGRRRSPLGAGLREDFGSPGCACSDRGTPAPSTLSCSLAHRVALLCCGHGSGHDTRSARSVGWEHRVASLS